MFSAENFPELPAGGECEILTPLWQRIAENFELQGLLLLQIDINHDDFKAVSGFEIPAEPFNGSEKQWVSDVIADCFKKYPKAHIHNISHFALANVVKRYSQRLQGTNRVWFVPATSHANQFIFLGFPRHDTKIKEIPETFFSEVDRPLLVVGLAHSVRDMSKRLKVMELFVKEIGHDVASSVQATIAKARTIIDGRVEGTAILRKAKEIEDEILAAHRTAEFLGTAIDPNYQINDLKDFDLVEIADFTIARHASEAAERHIEIKLTTYYGRIPLWGDPKAVEQCLGQLLINAIKYAFGGTSIFINIRDDGEFVILSVSNRGIPLPTGDEAKQIWDFGFRGKSAKELHVNGSGIGLYTVKKIALAHHGTITAGQTTSTTNFYLRVPKKGYLQQQIRLLL